jgi:hypothetical protein
VGLRVAGKHLCFTTSKVVATATYATLRRDHIREWQGGSKRTCRTALWLFLTGASPSCVG